MPTYEQLYHLTLTNLSTAADRWRETSQKFKELQADYADHVHRPFRDAGWAEPAFFAANADLQLRQIKQEYADAEAEARAVYGVLKTLYDELKDAKADLHHVAGAEAKKQGLHVSATGKVTPRHDLSKDSGAVHDPDGAELIRKQQDQCDALAARLTKILHRAAEADETACWALKRNLGGDRGDFNSKGLATSLDSADSIRALDLAKKGAKMSDTELKQLNELLKDNKGDKEFAEKFAIGMKAKGSLQLWAELTGRPLAGGQLSGPRKDILEDLQVSLGHTLGTATQSDSQAMKDWKAEMLELGPDPVANHSQSSPSGYQVMSSLMRNGKYDDAFLNDYGTGLIKHEKEQAEKYGGLDQVWRSGVYGSDLNLGGGKNDQGNDPMTGFMEALGHNATASAEFFKDEENFDYLVGGSDDTPAREWPPDTVYGDKPEKTAGHNSLGHALESATLGVAHGAPVPPFHRTSDGADIAERVIQAYGENPKLLHERLGIGDSISKVGAGYIDDLNNGYSNFGDRRGDDRDPLYDTKGQAHASIDREESRKFLTVMGQKEDTHAAMSRAQQAYTLGVLDSPAAAYPQHAQGAISAVGNSAEIHGLLDSSRVEQIRSDAAGDVEKQKEDLAKSTDWIKYGVGSVVGTGVGIFTGGAGAAIAVPIVAEVVGGAVETHVGHEVDDAAKKYEMNKSDDVNDAESKYRSTGEGRVSTPIDAYKMANGIGDDSNVDRELIRAASNGYEKTNKIKTEPYKAD